MPDAKTAPFRIFIGYDKREIRAYHTLCQSIIETSTIPVAITPIATSHLNRVYQRERDPYQSTDFSFTRFLVPYLCGYNGWGLFIDCDMLVRCDIAELQQQIDEQYTVMVVKHDYTPKCSTKFKGEKQTQYAKKNWSSLMLMNAGACRVLTPEYVQAASGLELHQFKWISDAALIGELPKHFNHLIGEYEDDTSAKILHFTLGGPWWPEYTNVSYAEEWIAVNRRSI